MRRLPTRIALWVLGAAAAGAGVFALLVTASLHWVAANSDGATIVLQGQSMRSGSILLSGWSLPLDSFFTTEVPFYAIADALVGSRHDLVNLVPSVIAALVVLVGIAIAVRPGRGSAKVAAAAFVLALLALPSPALSFFFLQGPWHVGTALACLVAFAGASSGKFDVRALLGVVALTLGLLGDVQTLALGVLPVLVGGVVGASRARSPRVAGPPAAIAVGAAMLAYGLRKLADAIGTFTLVGANPTARFSQIGANLGHLPSRFAGLFGVGTVPIGPDTTPSRFAAVHAIALAVVLGGFALALFSLLRGAIFGDARGHRSPRSRALDDFLVLGVVGDLAAFVLLASTGNGDYARYLTAGVVFIVVLVGRQIARAEGGARRRGALAVSGALLLATSIGFAADLGQRAVSRPAATLGPFLASRGLTNGLGDYWSASIVTASTGGRVRVRPVISTPTGALARYGRESTSAWYRGERFTFLVFDLHRPWRSVNAVSALATFGPAKAILAEGTYRIYVFSAPKTISDVGFSNA